MDAIRHRAICLNLATHIESLGNGHSVVFHSSVRMNINTPTHTHTEYSFCFMLFVCSGDSQEERGFWESEGVVTLDTRRHVSPALHACMRSCCKTHSCEMCLNMTTIWNTLKPTEKKPTAIPRKYNILKTAETENKVCVCCQTSRCLGEWERTSTAEDKSGPSVQAAYRHCCPPGPKHLQVGGAKLL